MAVALWREGAAIHSSTSGTEVSLASALLRVSLQLAEGYFEAGTLKRGFIFITADHRLLYPSTGLDVIDDMKTLFTFLASPEFNRKHLPAGLSVDANRIAIMGASGGGYAARAAGLYAHPHAQYSLSLGWAASS